MRLKRMSAPSMWSVAPARTASCPGVSSGKPLASRKSRTSASVTRRVARSPPRITSYSGASGASNEGFM